MDKRNFFNPRIVLKEHEILTANQKRIISCRNVGSEKKIKGHKRENDFNKKYNPKGLGTIEYGPTSDSYISSDSLIIPILKDKFNLTSFNTSNKSGNNIQMNLGNIPELERKDNLEFIQNKNNSLKLFRKYLKKSESEKPADLLVYKNKITKRWEFFKMDDVVDFIVNNCKWRKLSSGRLKGDFEDDSKKGKRQYLTYEFRKTCKQYFIGANGNKGLPFINLLKSSKGIEYYSEFY